MTKPKEKWTPIITHVVPKGTELEDGTILDKETTLSQEEFAKNPPVIPDGHSFYDIWARIIREKVKKGEL